MKCFLRGKKQIGLCLNTITDRFNQLNTTVKEGLDALIKEFGLCYCVECSWLPHIHEEFEFNHFLYKDNKCLLSNIVSCAACTNQDRNEFSH